VALGSNLGMQPELPGGYYDMQQEPLWVRNKEMRLRITEEPDRSEKVI